MDIIANLQLTFESVSNELEQLENAVAEQEKQIKAVREEKNVQQKEILASIKNIEHLEKLLAEDRSREMEMERVNRRLELELECLEEASSQIPKLLVKSYEEFLNHCDSSIASIISMSRSAVENGFWIEQTLELIMQIDKLRAQLKSSRAYRVQAEKAVEMKLSTQLQEEELNLAYYNSCIEALRQKNAELAEINATKSANTSRNAGTIDATPRATACNNGRNHTYSRGSESTGASSTAAFSTYTSGGGGGVTHTVKRTVTEEIIAFNTMPVFGEDSSPGTASQTMFPTEDGLSTVADSDTGGMWAQDEPRVVELDDDAEDVTTAANDRTHHCERAQTNTKKVVEEDYLANSVYDVDGVDDIHGEIFSHSENYTAVQSTMAAADSNPPPRRGVMPPQRSAASILNSIGHETSSFLFRGVGASGGGGGGGSEWFRDHKRKRKVDGATPSFTTAADLLNTINN